MLSLTQQPPYQITLSGNDMIFIISTDVSNVLQHWIEMRIVLNGQIISEWAQVMGGKAQFNIKEYFKTPKNEIEHNIDATLCRKVDVLQTFTCSFYEYHSNNNTPVQSLDIAQTFSVLIGGVSNQLFKKWTGAGTNFYNYSRYKTLTWQPALRKVLTDEPLRLYYYNATHTILKLYVVVWFSDETVVDPILFNGEVSQYSMYEFKVGFTELDLAQYETVKKIMMYDVWILSGTGVAVNGRRFLVDRDNYSNTKQIFFQNSFGVLDYLCIKNCIEETTDEYEKNIYQGNSLKFITDIEQTGNGKLNLGFIINYWDDFITARNYLRELMFSPKVYILSENGEATQIYINSKKVLNSKSNDEKLMTMEFEYETDTENYFSFA